MVFIGPESDGRRGFGFHVRAGASRGYDPNPVAGCGDDPDPAMGNLTSDDGLDIGEMGIRLKVRPP
jgi:hypothetical protein